MYTEQITQRLAIAAAVNPQTLNNASAATGSVDMSKSRRAFFILEIGAVTSGGLITAQLQYATTSAPSTWTNLSLTNTSLTGLNTANTQYTFEVNADQLPQVGSTVEFLRLNVTETAGHNVVVTAIAYGDEGIHKPNSQYNDTSVTTQQVVTP